MEKTGRAESISSWSLEVLLYFLQYVDFVFSWSLKGRRVDFYLLAGLSLNPTDALSLLFSQLMSEAEHGGKKGMEKGFHESALVS